MSTRKKSSTRTRKPSRRATLNRIRKALTDQYHAMSTVACDDRIQPKEAKDAGKVTMLPDGMTPDQVIIREPQLDEAITLVSAAINCLNRELGRKENT